MLTIACDESRSLHCPLPHLVSPSLFVPHSPLYPSCFSCLCISPPSLSPSGFPAAVACWSGWAGRSPRRRSPRDASQRPGQPRGAFRVGSRRRRSRGAPHGRPGVAQADPAAAGAAPPRPQVPAAGAGQRGGAPVQPAPLSHHEERPQPHDPLPGRQVLPGCVPFQAFPLYRFIYREIFFFYFFSISLSLSRYLACAHTFSVHLSPAHTHTHTLRLSLSPTHTLCLSLSLSHTRTLCLFLSPYLSSFFTRLLPSLDGLMRT